MFGYGPLQVEEKALLEFIQSANEEIASLEEELESLRDDGGDVHEGLLKLLSQYHAMRHLCSSHPNVAEKARLYGDKTKELYSKLFELGMFPVVYVITAHPDLTSFWSLLFRKELLKKTGFGKNPLILSEKPIFEKGISSFIAQQGTQGAVGAVGAEGAEGA
jgi:hypothetical protein